MAQLFCELVKDMAQLYCELIHKGFNSKDNDGNAYLTSITYQEKDEDI